MADFLKKDFASLVEDLLGDLSSGLGGRMALTDTTEGSVVRTLVEAFSRELAVTYAQMDEVYRLGYVGTAHGAALDNVVALLGVERRRGGYLQGTVTFTRVEPAPQEVPIPVGMPVAGRDTLLFETSARTAIPRGGTEATVEVRSVEPLPKLKGDAQKQAEQLALMTAPGALSLMPRPILGVDGVTNRVRLVQQQADETDVELRARARALVTMANLGTPAALQLSLRALGLTRVEVQEPEEQPGVVDVVVGDPGFDEELRKRAERVIEETRPAGVHVRLRGVTWVYVQVTATLELDKDYPEAERRAVEVELRDTLARYLQGLDASESVREAKVRNILASHDKVLDVYPKPGAEDGALLRAYVEKTPGKLEEQTKSRRQRNGDVQVGAAERATVDRERRLHEPFVLKLEPPAPRILVDVELQLRRDVLDAENAVREALREALAQAEEAVGPRALSYDAWEAKLPANVRDAVASLRFLVLHTRDGRTVELGGAGARDGREARERLELRNVTLTKVGGA